MPTNSQHGCSQIRYVETGGFEVIMPVILSIPIVVDIAPTEHFSVGVFISSLVAWAKIHGCASRKEGNSPANCMTKDVQITSDHIAVMNHNRMDDFPRLY